ncbi:cytochrome P450 [Streptomyces sp. B1866]|uniref:cytochrome P450 n=1 Tax=Streptomyces sp. B1866 TaxID=3075431 RepID=UPI00288C9BAD|nr:cytochrome P450 [Streptomyces sp. B1866]MDT3398604.1 cytochrome P450 [Streptomyces sp. B1866]
MPSFPVRRSVPDTPPDEHLELLEEGRGVCPFTMEDGRPAWLAASHEAVRTLLADRRISNNPAKVPAFSQREALQKQKGQFSRHLFNMDSPEHDIARRLVAGDFTPRHAEEVRPYFEEVFGEIVDEIVRKGPPAEMVEAFAFPVATRTICKVLDIPEEDCQYFQKRTEQIIEMDRGEENLEALVELRGYVESVVRERTRKPGDDLLSRMIVKARASDEIRLGDSDLVDNAIFLLVAGHEPSANMLGLGVLALAEFPDVAEELRADPGLWPGAIDEMLRYYTIARATKRVAAADIDIEGQTIKEGDAVIVLLDTSNRDPQMYPEPDRLDIRRQAGSHLAFSHGPHQCLGKHLVRVQLEVALRAVAERLPGLRLDIAKEDIPFRGDALSYGPRQLRVAW